MTEAPSLWGAWLPLRGAQFAAELFLAGTRPFTFTTTTKPLRSHSDGYWRACNRRPEQYRHENGGWVAGH
jgi:hypothetical protein